MNPGGRFLLPEAQQTSELICLFFPSVECFILSLFHMFMENFPSGHWDWSLLADKG